MPRGSTPKVKTPTGSRSKQPRKNSKIKRPEGWTHITGYRKILVATSKCGVCGKKPSHNDPPIPHRQCVTCNEKICWQCEDEAGGPYHQSAICNHSDPVPDNCSDTTASTENSRPIVYSFFGESTSNNGSAQREESSNLSTSNDNARLPKDGITVSNEKLQEDHDFDEGGSDLSQVPRTEDTRNLVMVYSPHPSRENKGKKTLRIDSDKCSHQNQRTTAIATDSRTTSVSPEVNSHTSSRLNASERAHYIARKKMLKDMGIWIEPDYAPPGSSPGSAQRKLVNATVLQLQEYAHKKKEWAFHTANSIDRPYSDNATAPHLPAYPMTWADPGSNRCTYQPPQAYYPYGVFPWYDQYLYSYQPVANWPAAFLQPPMRAEKYWEDRRGREASYLLHSTIDSTEARASKYSDMNIGVGTPSSADITHQLTGSQKRKGHKSQIRQVDHKRNKPNAGNHARKEKFCLSPSKGYPHKAQDVPAERTLTAAHVADSVLESNMGDEAEILTSRSFGRGRGRLWPTLKVVGKISNVEHQLAETRHPKPQPQASRILTRTKTGLFLPDLDLPSSPTVQSSLYQFPTSDIRSSIGRCKEDAPQPNISSPPKSKYTGHLDMPRAPGSYGPWTPADAEGIHELADSEARKKAKKHGNMRRPTTHQMTPGEVAMKNEEMGRQFAALGRKW